MQPQLLEALGLFQWLGFALLVVAWPVYEVLKLRRRARQAEDRAAQLTQDYQHRIEALDSVQRQAFEKLLQHPQPLRTPTAGFGPTLRGVAAYHETDPYAIPIGWQNSDGVADLVTGSLHGDSPYFVGNIQVTGMTRWGKNIWEFLTTTTLCYRTTPAQLRIFCIDGKGPDGALWRGLAHNWREPITREEDRVWVWYDMYGRPRSLRPWDLDETKLRFEQPVAVQARSLAKGLEQVRAQ